MGKTLTWEFLGKDKTSPELQKIARSFDDAAKRADKFGHDGSAALGDIAKDAERAKAATEDMADSMSESVQKAVDRITKARKVEADQLGRLRVAEVRLSEIRENAGAKASQVAAAEEAVAAAHRRVEAAQLAIVAAQRKLNTERDKANAVDDDPGVIAGPKFDLKSSLGRIQAQAVSELKSAGIVAGAAFAGALGAGISSVGAAGLFVAIAAAAQSSNEQVRESYADLWNQVKNQIRDASGVLADDFIKSAEQLGRTMNTIKPQLQEGFAAAQPVVADLTDGLDRMVRQALPGVVTGAKAAHLVTDGLADAMDHMGRGVANFFTESAEGAEAGGEAFVAFGKIVERLGSFGGRILSDLANASIQTGPALTNAVDSAATATENLAENALPGLASGAAMGLNALSLLLNLLNTLVTALGPAAPAVMNFLTALKLLDMVSFGAVQGRWDTFKKSIGDAPGFAGKAKAGFMGLVTTLGPVGLLAGAGALALDALGRSQQRTAERQQALNAAFRESKGAIDANVRATVAQSLAQEGLLEKGQAIGVSAATMTDAWLGNSAAAREVERAVQAYTASLEGQGQLEGQVAQGQDALSQKAYDVGLALSNQSGEVSNAAREGRLYADALAAGAGANAVLKKSIEDLQNTLAGLADKNLAYRNSVDATEDAQAAATQALNEMNEAQKTYGTNSPQYKAANEAYTDSVRGVEGAMLAQANAAREMGTSTSLATDDALKAADGQQAYAAEVVKMAKAAGESAPPALRQMISGLTNSELAALGAKREISATGDTVYRLPDGKSITVAAKDEASATANRVQRELDDIKNKTVTVSVITNVIGSMPGLQPLSAGRHSTGGWVSGPGTTTSDSIPSLLSNKEFVVRASQAQKHAPILEAINEGRDITGMVKEPGMAAAVSMAGAGGGGTVVNNNYYYTVTFSGPVGSRPELENWLAGAFDNLKRKGRA